MSLSMNGHLLRCRLRIRSSRTEQNAPVRVLAGALHLTIPEQAQSPDDSDGRL